MNPNTYKNLLETVVLCVEKRVAINEIGLPPKPYDHQGHREQFVNAAEKLNSGSGPRSIEEMEEVEKIHNPIAHHARNAHNEIMAGIKEADVHTQGALDKPEIDDTEASKIAASLHTDTPHYGNIDPNFHKTLRMVVSKAKDHHFNEYKKSIADNPAHVQKYGGSVDHHEEEFHDNVRNAATAHHDVLSTPPD